MRFLAEIVADVVYSLRIAAAGQWWLRALSAGSLLGAAMLCLWWFPVLLQGWLLAAVVLAGVWTVARPESFAPLGGIATVSVWWLAAAGGGDGARWWQTAAVAGMLAVFHLVTAHCAAAPSYTRLRADAVIAWLLRGLAYLGACGVAVGLVLGVTHLPHDVLPRGPAWIYLALAAVLAATATLHARITGRDD